MKKVCSLLFLLLLVSCSSLSLATKSHHAAYKFKSLTYADVKFQLSRLYYRPTSPQFVYWMPAYEGALNSWETISRVQQRWDMFYGPGGWDDMRFIDWLSPYYIDTWYNPSFGWYPNPNYYISPYTGNLLPRQETHVSSPRPKPKPKPRYIPRERPQPRVPDDIYMSRSLPRPVPTYSAPSRTAGETISRNVVRGSSPKGGRRQQ